MIKVCYFIKVKQISKTKTDSFYNSGIGKSDLYDYFSIDVNDDNKTEEEIVNIIETKHIGDTRYGAGKPDIIVHSRDIINDIKMED